MGPLPKGSGRASTLFSGSARIVCFNGAAAERQRKARAESRLRAAHRCFNGAAAERQRKDGGRTGWTTRRQAASMGPLPKGSGRPDVSVQQAASLALQWGRCRKAAEGCGMRTSVRARTKLQWGRCRKAAEGVSVVAQPTRHGCFNGAAAERQRKDSPPPDPPASKPLQWGRCRKAAEGRMSPLAHCRTWGASMGPLPKGSGRRKPRSKRPSVTQLQWGRCRKAAEGRTRPRDPRRATHRFNGAAAERQRKDVPELPVVPHREASMGPLPKGSGRSPARRR